MIRKENVAFALTEWSRLELDGVKLAIRRQDTRAEQDDKGLSYPDDPSLATETNWNLRQIRSWIEEFLPIGFYYGYGESADNPHFLLRVTGHSNGMIEITVHIEGEEDTKWNLNARMLLVMVCLAFGMNEVQFKRALVPGTSRMLVSLFEALQAEAWSHQSGISQKDLSVILANGITWPKGGSAS